MSSKWRYDSTDAQGEIMSIWSDGPITHELMIYPWKVRLNTGEIRGLYSLKLEEFTKEVDRKAFQAALRNAHAVAEQYAHHNDRVMAKVQGVWCC